MYIYIYIHTYLYIYTYIYIYKPTGLVGVWGPIVREWLEGILPKDISLKSTENLFIAATPVR
jgi:hypothetical protein